MPSVVRHCLHLFVNMEKGNMKPILDLLKSLSSSSLVQAVNELLESLGAPLEIVDGFVSSISVTIPWQALLTDHCTLEVLGLQITCRPKYRTSKLTGRIFGTFCTFWNPTYTTLTLGV